MTKVMEAGKNKILQLAMVAAVLILLSLFQAINVSAGENISVVGLVQDTGDGLVLDAEDQVYLLEGDLTDEMIDKRVKVTGELEIGEGGARFLIVKSYQEISD